MNEKETIIVNGYAYPSIDPDSLASWLPSLTLLSNFSYGFTPEGDIIDLDDENLIRAAQEAGGVGNLMVLTPLDSEGVFSNELARQLLENPAARENLIDNIINVLYEKELFGVDFDFEYVLAENRDQYTALVAEATERCNQAGFIVTVALAPKTSRDQPGLLYQGHDYFGMGQAANFVLLMTYEWGYTYGPPLPVAPLPSVRRVLDYGVSEIPPDKILMGMPNYGYDWTLPFVQGESRAEKISNGEAVARAARYGVAIEYNEEYQSPYYYYYDEENREHVVWFEDERSWQAKFNLVSEYGFAGISIWNIMPPFEGGRAILESDFNILKV